MQITYALNEIDAAAAWLLQQAGTCKVIALHGPMGAGKTTLVHHLCALLGVTGNVSSPTFSIINEYRCGEQSVFHLDLYRLKNEAEAIDAGVEDCINSGQLCLVEWPERAPGVFPEQTVEVYLTVDSPQTRTLQLK